MSDNYLASLDIFSEDFRRDPYSLYRYLHAELPVASAPFLPGAWLISRFADCSTILRAEHGWSSDERNTSWYKKSPAARMRTREEHHALRMEPFVKIDSPDHTRLRQLVNSAFTTRSIKTRRGRIEEVAAALLVRAREAGGVDIIKEFADLLPLIIIADVLGVPQSDVELLDRWSRELGQSLDFNVGMVAPSARLRRLRAQQEFVEYLEELARERRKHPRCDFLTELVQLRDQGGPMSYAEMMSVCMLLLIAGHETTSSLIGNTILTLWRYPGEHSRLRNDPSLIRPAIEEVLRFDAPVQATGRVALQDTAVGGVAIPAGDAAILLLGAAQRDPDRFENPHQFDIDRPDVGHLAFGAGPHFCLGAALARLEGEVALAALLAAPSYRVLEESMRYKPNLVFRGLATLEVEFI
jgi:cytochrome P450